MSLELSQLSTETVSNLHIVRSSDVVLEQERWPAHFEKFGRHTVTTVTKVG